jgi:ATP-dependent Lon protease
MKESALASLTYIRSRGSKLGITPQSILATDIHVHVPAGATPKDGPSAGIAITTAMISALTGKPPLPAIAMTGEITLTGMVLPIGGLREKLLAAKRAEVMKVIIPIQNQPDLKEIPPYVTRGMQIVTVENLDQALAEVFGKSIFARPASRSKKVGKGRKGTANAAK